MDSFHWVTWEAPFKGILPINRLRTPSGICCDLHHKGIQLLSFHGGRLCFRIFGSFLLNFLRMTQLRRFWQFWGERNSRREVVSIVRIWKTQQWPQDWKRSIFIPIPKNSNAKECLNYQTIVLISHASKVMLKIFQARLQQYVYHELPHLQAGFRKSKGTRDQIANICWIIEKSRGFQKNIYFCFIDYAKDFDCLTNWKIPQEMGIPDHLTCLLRNL